MIIFEYSDQTSGANVKLRMTEEGMDMEDYLAYFGYPDKFCNMQIDAAWFNPVLPGMEDYADVCITMAQAEDLLNTKKKEAFAKENGDSFFVMLTGEEYEAWSEDPDNMVVFEDENMFLYEDLGALIDQLIEGQTKWRVEGSNLTWRGEGGSKDIRAENSEDVLKIFRGYGDYSLVITQDEGEKDFTIACSHHDCPTGSIFNFSPIKE